MAKEGMNTLTAEECEQLISLTEKPRLIASPDYAAEQAALNHMVHRGLVNATL